jgi:ATP-dependent Clp protease adapter protein ClpS
MRQSRTLDLGMEVHQESMAVVSVSTDHDAELVSLGTVGTWPCDSAHLVRQRPS